MFKTIRTSAESKEIITKLTRKFDLKSENVIARIALAYSLENDGRLDLNDIKDSKGKEFNEKTLFGQQRLAYLGMICVNYKTDKPTTIRKAVKKHLDKGLLAVSDVPNIQSLL